MAHNKYKEKNLFPLHLAYLLSIYLSIYPSFNGCLVGTGSFQHCVGMCFAERTCGLESYVLKQKKTHKIAKARNLIY